MRAITACNLDCPDACSLLVWTDAEGKLQLKGNPDHPFTSGFTCKKSRNFFQRLQSSHRLKTPLLRVGKDWQAISWDEALQLCAEKIAEYRKEPASILHFHGEGAKGVLKQAGKLFFALLGSSQVKGSLCDAAGYVACVMDFGSRDNNDITDLLHAHRMVNWGKDLSRSSIHTAALVQKARRDGCRVLTISPGGDGNGPFSHKTVRIRPGTDRFLAAALIRLLLERQGASSAILERTGNGEAFLALIRSLDVDRLLQTCQVDPEGLESIYSFYAAPEPTATLMGAGVQRYAYGGENMRFINALALLSGNIGRSGGGSYFHLHSLRNLNLDWTKDPDRKPRRSLLMPTVGRDILAAEDPPIRMLWVEGSNVVNQAPDSHQVVRAFESIPFKVVVDAFMTDTAERADLVLPCALMMEQEDVEASYLHDFVHYVRPVLQAPGEARSDYWILSELGRRLDPPIILPDPETCFKRSLETPHLDASLEELRERNFVRARRRPVAYVGLKFDHPDGKYRFPEALHPEAPPPPGYPLRLLSLIRGEAIHSQILPEKQEMPPLVWVAPDCPSLEGLNLEEPVALVSPLGRLKVRVALLEGLHPEVVVYRRGDWMKLGGGANQLIAAALSDVGRGAPYYQQYARLENE